jgi:tetratricopeptide (TPR) repeat protein
MKKTYLIIPLLFAVVANSGCKKYLEQAPDMRTKLNSVDKVAELLTSAYPQAAYIPFMESASDNAEDKGPSVGNEPRYIVEPYYWRDLASTDQDTPTFYWNEAYTAISVANQALDAIEKAEDKTGYLPYKGEALVARAYAHFMLVTLYAKAYVINGTNDSPGIPYVTVPEVTVIKQYTRGTVASVYAQIEKDLEEGLPLLKSSSYRVPKYHFTPAAANAFAARFYLFKGDYAKVIQNASAISSNFEPIIRPWNSRYRYYTLEERQTAFSQATEDPTLLLIETASSWARTTSPRYGFGQMLNDAMFGTVNVTGARFGHSIAYYGVPHYTFLKFNEHFVRTSANATIGYPYTIIPVLTTDEALMNRAEAYAATGDYANALADLNTFASTRINDYNRNTQVITLAKIAAFYRTEDPKAGLIRTILDFKKAEFVHEGLRWFDILRHRLTVEHNVRAVNGTDTFIKLEPDDPRRLFQLPSQVALSGVEVNPR